MTIGRTVDHRALATNLGQTVAVTRRKVGIEEELLLVDPKSGRLRPVSHRALAAHRGRVEADDRSARGDAGEVEQELFLQQIETGTTPCRTVPELEESVRSSRRLAGEAAAAVGAGVVAVPTPVLTGDASQVTPNPRYQRIVDEFGPIGDQAGVAGMHVHVDVTSDDEAVAVLDRVRPWLPVLLALSANSPFWQGADTGYASWRAQVWRAWPAAGQSEPYGDVAGYRSATQALIESGAALDSGMLYLDARLAESYPTVEVRVADVCTEVDDVMLLAALARGLVDTAARDWTSGADVPVWRTDLLRAAHWKASRYGVSHDLVHPATRRPARAREVVEGLVDHVSHSLDESGDLERVQDGFERLLARGSGASRQRAVAESGGVDAVAADLLARTEASWQVPAD